MKLHCALFSFSVVTCLLSSAVVHAQPPDRQVGILHEDVNVIPVTASPHNVIESFVRFYNSDQWRSLPDLITGAEPDDAALTEIAEAITKARGTLRLRVADIRFEPAYVPARDDVTAMLTVHAIDDMGMGMSWRETLKLHRERVGRAHDHDIWKLRPSEPRVIDTDAFDGYLQRLITLIAYPKKMVALHRQRGQREGATQVKQLTLGVKQFLQDHDEQFAFTPETVKTRIRPYIRDDALWTAPGDVPGTQSYALNPHLANVNEAEIEFIADTVLFYLGRDEKLDFRYDGKTVIGFADGHVELLTEEQTKKLRWKP